MNPSIVADRVEQAAPATQKAAGPPKRPRRRAARVALIALGVVAVLAVLAALVFVFGRDRAEELTDDQALADFRASAGQVAADDVRPAPGIYAATASGRESIGLPGFDEELGPNAPVTVTHGDRGCFTYRADFNSHHWRSWTFCPSDTATYALAQLDTWTARKAPGLDIATLSTYSCNDPLDVFWRDAAIGQKGTGECRGTTDTDDTVTEDAGTSEVLGTTTLTVDGEPVEAVLVRTSDTFSGAQQGNEVGEWWLHATTGLPLKAQIEASLTGGPSDYSETIELELSTLTPAT
jgi:type II secretory pathway pseudopilin PulG